MFILSLQCATDNGVCPDIRANTNSPGTNDVTLSGFTTDDGITRINYKRPLNASKIHYSP